MMQRDDLYFLIGYIIVAAACGFFISALLGLL
jgi:hypothetical protein